MIVVDTLRADRVGAQGAGPSSTPQLDAFARECLVFDHAQSPRAKTTPAVASLLTGLYPHDHGVRDLTAPIASDVPLWPEALRENGYRTGALIGNYVLQDRLSGLARGFDLWVQDLPDERGVPPENVAMRGAESLTDGVLCALGLGAAAPDGAGPTEAFVADDQPWFLWAHYMDPHGAYEPPEPHRSEALEGLQPGADVLDPNAAPDAEAEHRRWIAKYNVPAEARLANGTIDVGHVRALYDGEVRYVDAQLGRLFNELRATGTLENTIVVITADHGESLGEHDYWFEHGRYAYEATCRVPLLIRLPDSWTERPAPGARHGDVSLADVRPTLAALGVPDASIDSALDDVRGVARLAAVRTPKPTGPPVYCEKIERADTARVVQTKAVRVGDWKLLRRYTHVVAPETPEDRRLVILSEELYDLANDPTEARSLRDAPPRDAPVDALKRALLAFSSADEHFADLAQRLQEQREKLGRTDPKTLRALQALGY